MGGAGMIEFVHLFLSDAKVFMTTILVGVPVLFFVWFMWKLGKELGIF